MTKIEIEAEVFGDWAFAGADVYHDGKRVPLTPQQGRLLHLIALDYQSAAALCQHLSPGADPEGKLVYVHLVNIRDRLADLGLPVPWENVSLRGYRWIG